MPAPAQKKSSCINDPFADARTKRNDTSRNYGIYEPLEGSLNN